MSCLALRSWMGAAARIVQCLVSDAAWRNVSRMQVATGERREPWKRICIAKALPRSQYWVAQGRERAPSRKDSLTVGRRELS